MCRMGSCVVDFHVCKWDNNNTSLLLTQAEEGRVIMFCSCSLNHSQHRPLSLQGVFVFDCPDSPQRQNSQSQIESRKEDFKRKDKGADMP